MKRKSGFWIILFTCAAVAVGFSLPKLAADHQEKQLMSKVSAYESETIRFPTAYHVLDCMNLLSSGYERVDLAGGREHTPEEIASIAQDVLKLLEKYNYIWPGQGVMTAEPPAAFLAVRNEPEGDKVAMTYTAPDGSERSLAIGKSDPDGLAEAEESSDGNEAAEEKLSSAIVWECVFSDEDRNTIRLYIDDLSGKMISARCHCPNRLLFYQEDTAREYMELFRETFVTFVEEYYRVADAEADLVYGGGQGEFFILFRDKNGDNAHMLIEFSGTVWEFNPIFER